MPFKKNFFTELTASIQCMTLNRRRLALGEVKIFYPKLSYFTLNISKYTIPGLEDFRVSINVSNKKTIRKKDRRCGLTVKSCKEIIVRCLFYLYQMSTDVYLLYFVLNKHSSILNMSHKRTIPLAFSNGQINFFLPTPPFTPCEGRQPTS